MNDVLLEEIERAGYRKLPENPESNNVAPDSRLYRSQEKVRDEILKDIKESRYRFFSINGDWGSGKTFVSHAVGNSLGYTSVTYKLWTTNFELLRKNFLNALYRASKKNNKKDKNRRIELSIACGKLVKPAYMIYFVVLFIILFFSAFNLSNIFITSYFQYINPVLKEIIKSMVLFLQGLCIFKFTFFIPLKILAFTANIIVSLFSACVGIYFFYKKTDGNLYNVKSLFGIDVNSEMDTYNYEFSEILKEVISNGNFFIILDNIDRVPEKHIDDVIAFLDDVKENIHSLSNKNVYVCVPIYKDRVIDMLTSEDNTSSRSD